MLILHGAHLSGISGELKRKFGEPLRRRDCPPAGRAATIGDPPSILERSSMKSNPSRFLLPALAAALSLAAVSPVAAQEEKTRTEIAMTKQWGAMLKGSGEWRAPNPDFADPKTTPKEYAVRFRWGPYRQDVVGELVGFFETEKGMKEARFWNFYSYHNPVTDEILLVQVGWDGAMGSGPMSVAGDGTETVDQIFYAADGKMRIVRHVTTHVGADAHNSDVYERDDKGEWKLERKWTWTLKKP
jgi:hypothetical protein